MALLEKHLYVKKSNIPGAGKGLYTKVDIPKGKKIIEYKGHRTVWKEVKDDDGINGYIFYINKNCVIDALADKKALARYANDALGLTRIEGLKNNCEYIIDGKKCFIHARKDIPAKSELLVGYGADYWKTISENKKLNKKGKSKSVNKKAKRKKLKRMEQHHR